MAQKSGAMVSLFFMVLLLTQCSSETGTNPSNPVSFTFQFHEDGGVGGVSNSLTYSETDSVIYMSKDLQVSREWSPANRQALYTLLQSTRFFEMDSTYLPDHIIMDDILLTLNFTSPSKSMHIVASGFCSGASSQCTWPQNLYQLIDSLQQRIKYLRKSTTTGCITITKKYTVAPWQFDTEVVLADSLSRTFVVSDSVYNAVLAAQNSVLFYEGTWLYRMNVSFDTTPENDVVRWLSIHDRTHPAYWPGEPKLVDFPDSGIRIDGMEYTWIDSVFSQDHYPWYFMDAELAPGEPAYELRFIRGNACR